MNDTAVRIPTVLNGTSKMNGHRVSNGVASKHTSNGTRNSVVTNSSNGTPNGLAAESSKGYFHLNGHRKKHGQSGADSPDDARTMNGHSGNHRDLTFLKCVTEVIMKDALDEGLRPESKVVDFHHPEELQKLLDLRLGDKPTSDDKLIDLCRQIIRYSVKTGHENFHNQLFGGMDFHSLAGSWLTDALNPSQYTYEVAPVFTLMEREVFAQMRAIIGFPSGDGIFCPGGSISNMYAISLARFRLCPEIKTKGMQACPPLCILTSEQCHYSWQKGAAFLGIGMDNVIDVKCDARGKMIPEELEQTIADVKEQGFTPLLVNATAGTTVLGAYDPLEEIASICERYGIWMHVDGAWGGSVVLSKNQRHIMKGIERADSMTWNPHKMMGVIFQCSAFLTRHENLLSQCHSANATYLFQQDKFYDVSFDTGDKSIQCGRKVDVLKLWLLWKAKGHLQYQRDIDNVFDCARYLAREIKTRPGFRLVISEPECTNVCFWYIPHRLRGLPETPEWWTELGKVAPQIKKRMVKAGSILVGYQPLGDLPNFFRLVIPNLQTTRENMDDFIQEIERQGADL